MDPRLSVRSAVGGPKAAGSWGTDMAAKIARGSIEGYMARMLVFFVIAGVLGYAKYSYRAERRAARQAQTQNQRRPVVELEHCVQICFRLSDNESGTEQERRYFQKLSDQIDSAIYTRKLGECDPIDVGGGFFVMHIYGPSAKKIWEAIETDVRNASFKPGSYVIHTDGTQNTLNHIRYDL